MIRAVVNKDASSIVNIYNHYIAETVATFEVESLTAENILERITKVKSANLPWLIAENESGEITGYAYASQWKERFAYRFSVEITVYLSPNFSSQGIGTKLYHALFSELKLKSVHSVIGGITLPNPASVALHEKFGMKQVAHFKEVGFKFNRWLDTGYWQVSLKA